MHLPVSAGAASVTLVAALWAGLCWMLAERGFAPSVQVLPIPPTDYYRVQALALIPVLLSCWLLLSAAAHALSRRLGGRASLQALLGPLGVTYAAVLGVAFVIPDIVTYALYGFEALGRLVRVTGALTALALLASTTLVIARVHRISRARAAVASIAGLVAQGLVAGPLLR